MSPAPIRVLVAEDERVVRDDLADLVRGQPDALLVGTARTGTEALRLIGEHEPDLAFLDVRMPGMTGLEVAASLEPGFPPLVVFVTAHDRYAVKAFELQALDYLLKPFDRDQFTRTFQRARIRLEQASGQAATGAAWRPASVPEQQVRLDRLAVRRHRRAVVVELRDVIWFEAADNYVRLHLPESAELTRRALGDLEAMLDPTRFRRISRSAIVNLCHVRTMEPLGHGDWQVTLHTGRKLALTRSYRDAFLEAFGGLA